MDLKSEAITLPRIDLYADELVEFCRSLRDSLDSAADAPARTRVFEQLRGRASQYLSRPSLVELKYMFLCNVVLDLAAHGWSIEFQNDEIRLQTRPPSTECRDAEKEKIRARHLLERDAQLREDSVREFISEMERRRLTPKGWHSIYSVMRDGQDLAELLQKCADEKNLERRRVQLERAVDPYLQFVTPDAVCSETGLRLNEIWRYFRHTWVNIYRSVPGRSIMVLVRDRAAEGHPIIGIAALGSSVVQQAVRDRWIEWDAERAIDKLKTLPSRVLVDWLSTQVREHIAAIYRKDFERERVLTTTDLRYPSDAVISRLRKESAVAIELHRKYPHAAEHKRNGSGNHTNWAKMARTPLFRSKRAKQLAILLSIRKTFNELGLARLGTDDLRLALQSPKVRHTLSQLTRIVKAEKVGISMMDVIVCGAIAPYNSLLGGKLVCLLLCSPEMVRFYARRYRNQVSVIASAMKGGKVRRNPRLVLLCTTSLYGTGSSQYNRIKVPAALVGGAPEAAIAYEELGTSEGFGSFHFSKETLRLADALLGRSKNGRKVNSIFGEGVNPLMRKIREALEFMDLPSDALLRHGDKRIVYGIPLATNFRSHLLGLDAQPRYIIPLKNAGRGTNLLVRYWRDRWLSKRVESAEVLQKVSEHTLSYPIRHGAQVLLPEEDEKSLFTTAAAFGN
jgi:hypothetical protein